MRVVKGVFRFLAVAVVICCSLFFVACNENKHGGIDEGKVYGVTFNAGVSGVTIDAQVVGEGDKLIEPDVPLRAGYKFVGWKVDGRFWNFNMDRVFSSFELTADWELDSASWVFTEGLQFGYNEDTKSYDVTGYVGDETEVQVPLYYSGDEGGHPVGIIADSAFAGNSVIKKIVIATNVGASSFAGSSIEEVVFNVSEVNIGASAFSGTPNLSRVSFLDNDTDLVIGASGFAGSGLGEISLPDGTREIGASCFAGSEIYSVRFGSGAKLETIGAAAFYNTKLTRLVLPRTVKSIGEGAFQNNKLLKNIVMPSEVVTLGSGLFVGCDNLSEIYFTGGTKSVAYSSDVGWNPQGLNEYFYSEVDNGNPGFWRGFDLSGDPIKYTSVDDYTFDLRLARDNLSLGNEAYKIILNAYYRVRSGVYSCETKIIYFDEDFVANATLDSYKIELYSIEVYNIDETQLGSANAVLRLYDIDVQDKTIVASGVDIENKTIII